MLRALTLSATLARVLDPLRSCFTAPSFETSTALVAGLVAQPVSRTVCGMLTGGPDPGCGSTAGRTGSSPRPGGVHGRWDWSWPGWWWLTRVNHRTRPCVSRIRTPRSRSRASTVLGLTPSRSPIHASDQPPS